jgi:hypothetical protein
MSVRKRKRYATVAHVDIPELTLRDVEIPAAVPLYENFSHDKQIGTARLRKGDAAVYAIIEPTWESDDWGDEPMVILGFDGGEAIEEDGVTYLTGGTIASATLISEEVIRKAMEVDSQ